MHLPIPRAIRLALAALLLPAVPCLAQERDPAPIPLSVVHHGGDAALRDRLLLAAEVWYDAGDFLVLRGRPALLGTLAARGVAWELLPPVLPDEDLFLVGVTEDATLERIRAAGGRLVYRKGVQTLVAIAPGLEEELHDLEPGRFFHCGLARVAPRAIAAPRVRGLPPGSQASLLAADPRIQGRVDAVDAQNIEGTVQSLSSIFSRRADQPGALAARDLLVAQLQGLGLTPYLQSFGAQYAQNVVAEIPGLVAPNEVIVIGAHYDSVNWANGSTATAPGADDNASGTGGVLEAARVLVAGGPYERTLRFILFSGEELGLLGSAHAAQQSVQNGELVVAMLNMDMIAYRAPGGTRDVDFATNNTTAWLVDLCDQLGQLYVPNWASKSGVLTAGSSDHASYFNAGWPAAFFFEDLAQYFSQIHTANDVYPTSTTDFLLARMAVQGVVATAATLAEPASLVVAHTPLGDTEFLGPYAVSAGVTSLSGANVTTVELHWRANGGAWNSAPMQLQGAQHVGQIPAQGSPVVFEYYLVAEDDGGGRKVAPPLADLGAAPFGFLVGVQTVHFFDDFETPNDNGWVHGAAQGQDDWQRGVPQGKAGDPGSAFSGLRVWGNDLGPSGWNGAYQGNVSNWLRSPTLDLSGAQTVYLRFQRWLTVEDGLYDQAQVRVNGQVVWQNETGVPGDDANHTIDTAWTRQQLDLTAFAAGNPAVQIEFRLITDGGLHFGGWNVDDVSVFSLDAVSCPAPTGYCVTTPNSMGSGAVISSNGATSLAANAFELEVTGAIPNQNGIFFYGPTQVSVAFGNGLRCVGGSVQRLPVVAADFLGDVTYSVDFANLPSGGAILPGSTWNFQFWYRDPAAGGAGFDLSDALSVTFCD